MKKMALNEEERRILHAIADYFGTYTGCDNRNSFPAAIQYLHLKAIQEQTEAIKELTNIIKRGLNVADDLPSDHPIYKTPESW